MKYSSTPEEQVASGQIRFEGGDGSSVENVVVIKGASSASDGIASELIYLEQKFGKKDVEWNFKSAAHFKRKWKHFDVIEVELNSSKSDTSIYFDISSFFGKE
jgi:hypothetical protein